MSLSSVIRKARRFKVSEAVYLVINALLPIVLLIATNVFNSFYPALVLVLLSKWRIVALRPRFWWMSLKANAVDILFGLSVVALLYMFHTPIPQLPAQIAVAAGYAGWLLYLKHKSSPLSIVAQAGITQFLSLTVLFALSTALPDLVVILGCWVIGYSTARHVLVLYNDELANIISYTWGLIFVELGWVLYHWTVSYDVGLTVKIPQMSLISLVISFAAARLYIANKSNTLSDPSVRLSTIFSVVLLLIILVFTHWDASI